jgi:hypothetical protein
MISNHLPDIHSLAWQALLLKLASVSAAEDNVVRRHTTMDCD